MYGTQNEQTQMSNTGSQLSKILGPVTHFRLKQKNYTMLLSNEELMQQVNC